MNHAFALLIQSTTFWSCVWLLRDQGVSMVAWLTLYLCCVSAAAALQVPRFTARTLRPGAWLLFAVNTVLVAALFWGANTGLDLINGPHRARVDWAAGLGGLEFWFALCPGVLSVAIAGWACSLRRQPSRPVSQAS